MKPYAGRRSREYLYEDEVQRMFVATKKHGEFGNRNATLIWLMYIHGLRSSEARALRWSNVDFSRKQFFVKRVKNGKDTTHPLTDYEVTLLERLHPLKPGAPEWVFTKKDGEPLGRSTVYKIIREAGKRAGLEIDAHPHMLRHACGYHLINERGIDIRRVQEYLGHRDIKHTVIYTELDANKFNNLWEDGTDTT